MRTVTIHIPPARWLMALTAAVLMALAVSACNGNGNTTGQVREQTSSNDSLYNAESVLPAPVFKYSVYRWAFIESQAVQALGEQTTSFIWSNNDGPSTTIPPGFFCPSIGMPVPNTAQLTNPDKVVHDPYPNGGAALTVGNIDPNQLYSPSNSQGTNILCVNRLGQEYLVYAEPNVITVSGEAHWVKGQGIVQSGAVHMPNCQVLNAGTKKAATTCAK